jgi:protein-L-isoaspartate(D-aspartate) O-methyltransferase
MTTFITALCLCVAGAARAQNFDAARTEMVRVLEGYRAEMERAIGPGALRPEVIKVMGEVPRHEFVTPAQRAHAYDNRPLPIGHSQTISQPLIVALMTSLLDAQADHTVLEVGTGSGYQAAVLSPLVQRVHTIEIVAALADESRERLARLGYANVEVRAGDGYRGWPEAAPFDRILVTAAPDRIPPALVEQLKPGGRMVLPVGERAAVQQLTLIEKDADGATRVRELLPVRFVPMTGEK